MVSSHYVYRPLEGPGWIRVVQLLPAAHSADELHCRLIHLDRETLFMSANPELNYYQAVSYVWGASTFSHSAYVHAVDASEDDTKLLKITKAVDVLLRRFRKPRATLNLWIDGMSLNQADETEIEQQISHMGAIYNQSSKSRIWLGSGNHETPQVYALIRTFAQCSQNPDLAVIGHKIQKLMEPRNETAIDRFLCCTWFTRRWVLQELALSRVATIYCGNCKLPWKLMLDGLDVFKALVCGGHMRQSYALSHAATQALSLACNLSAERHTLLHNLWTFHTARCTDQRDIVRSLLGFSDPKDSYAPAHDIDNSNTHQDLTIMHKTAIAYVRAGKIDSIIHHALAFCNKNMNDLDRPSWVPNWDKERMFNTPVPVSSSDLWRACRITTLDNQYTVSPDGRILFMREMCMRITHVSDRMSSVTNWTAVLEHVCQLHKRMLKQGELFMLARTLVHLSSDRLDPPYHGPPRFQRQENALYIRFCELAGLTVDGSFLTFDIYCNEPLSNNYEQELDRLLDSARTLLTTSRMFACDHISRYQDYRETSHGFGNQDMFVGDLVLLGGPEDREIFSPGLGSRVARPLLRLIKCLDPRWSTGKNGQEDIIRGGHVEMSGPLDHSRLAKSLEGHENESSHNNGGGSENNYAERWLVCRLDGLVEFGVNVSHYVDPFNKLDPVYEDDEIWFNLAII